MEFVLSEAIIWLQNTKKIVCDAHFARQNLLWGSTKTKKFRLRRLFRKVKFSLRLYKDQNFRLRHLFCKNEISFTILYFPCSIDLCERKLFFGLMQKMFTLQQSICMKNMLGNRFITSQKSFGYIKNDTNNIYVGHFVR